jgi:hypothetical protein
MLPEHFGELPRCGMAAAAAVAAEEICADSESESELDSSDDEGKRD